MKKFRLFTVSVALAAMVGCASDPSRSAGQRLDDRLTTSRIADALGDSPVYKFPQVKVSTYNGVVQLSGFVHSQEQKQAAAHVAQKAPGVAQVINNISVLSPDPAMGAARAPRSQMYGSERNTTNIRTNDTQRIRESDIRK
jgi:hyperosmotically inducible periplasmic protein